MNKIIDFNEFQAIKNENDSLRFVQCHGVFDLLHVGHIKHFQNAKALGDVLIVTITPDRFVNKGPNRPCFTERLRADAIAALECVDYVIINRWPTAIEAIKLIKPHVYIKGSEYKDASNDLTAKISDEIDAVKSVGGNIGYTDEETFSSSTLLNQHFSPFSDEVVSYLNGFKKRFKINDILKYFESAQKLKVLVVGEAIIDTYHFSDVIGKAGKEPTLVARENHQESYLGGSLALANHLSDFCQDVTCLTYLGENAEFEGLITTGLKKNVQLNAVYKKASPTIQKRRYLDEYLKQKLFEVYEINDEFFEEEQQQEFLSKIDQAAAKHDLVIVVDYGHGLLNEEAINELTQKAKFLAVNTQSNAGNNGFKCISQYPKADFVAIANRELQLNYRQKHLTSHEQLQRLDKQYDYKNIMITNGSRGAYACKQHEMIYTVPAFATKIVDRVGAGDAVLAITSLFAYQDAPAELIAFAGNIVGAQAVSIMGNKRFIEKVPLMKHLSHMLK